MWKFTIFLIDTKQNNRKRKYNNEEIRVRSIEIVIIKNILRTTSTLYIICSMHILHNSTDHLILEFFL